MPQTPNLAAFRKLRLLKTEVKQSTLPLPSIDSIAFPTESLFPQLKPGSNEVTLKVTYLSECERHASRTERAGPR